MKTFKLLCTVGILFSLLVNSAGNAQDAVSYKPAPADVESLDGIIEALYASISGEKGEPRQWDRFRSLFTENARLIPTGVDSTGNVVLNFMTPEDFIEMANPYFVEAGFYEKEAARSVQYYGRIIHMFSTYVSFRTKEDTEPFNRGINSIQLMYDGKRYWIVNIYWAHESESNPIPEEYLPK